MNGKLVYEAHPAMFRAHPFWFILAVLLILAFGLGIIIAGTMCVLGHDYPAWLGFKGGKGIATMAGVLLAVFPPLVCISFGAVWVVVFLIGRYTSLASMVAVVTPIAAASFVSKSDPDFPFLIGFCILMAALALWRHRSNIVRLLNGTENRFGKK